MKTIILLLMGVVAATTVAYATIKIRALKARISSLSSELESIGHAYGRCKDGCRLCAQDEREAHASQVYSYIPLDWEVMSEAEYNKVYEATCLLHSLQDWENWDCFEMYTKYSENVYSELSDHERFFLRRFFAD